MKDERELQELDRITYKDRTIVIYRETFVVDGLKGPETLQSICARIMPADEFTEWQDGLEPDRQSIFEAFKDLIDARKI